MIEAARQRKQQALEQALADKRAEQQAYAMQLQQDEMQQFQQQQLLLNALREKIDAEATAYSSRFSKVEVQSFLSKANTETTQVHFQHSEQDQANIRLRLELESEQIIQQALSDLKVNLQQAAQEEINFILEKLNN